MSPQGGTITEEALDRHAEGLGDSKQLVVEDWPVPILKLGNLRLCEFEPKSSESSSQILLCDFGHGLHPEALDRTSGDVPMLRLLLQGARCYRQMSGYVFL